MRFRNGIAVAALGAVTLWQVGTVSTPASNAAQEFRTGKLGGVRVWQVSPSSPPTPTNGVQQFRLARIGQVRVWQASPSGVVPPPAVMEVYSGGVISGKRRSLKSDDADVLDILTILSYVVGELD